MKYSIVLATVLALASIAFALDGQFGIHDPSTVVICNGKYYTYGTGGSSLVSDDGWTWRQGTALPRRGLAPDVIHLGDRYYVYVAANIGAQPKAAVNMIWSKTLDPDFPDYKWEEGGVVASSDGVEDSNAIDPGVFLDPTDHRLWLVYGSYFGYIRLVELDPKTGKRLHPGDQPRNLAINCEASDMMYHDGWYYLLATHGSCCRGADSGYNIRMGRARKVTGPFLDNEGVDMILGGGKLFAGSGGRFVGPGHFGLLDLGQGVQKFSLHYEADLDKGGASVLDIRPLLWKDGWPVAGDNLKEGTYEIESVRTGTALELAVEGMPVGGRLGRGGRGGGGRGAPGAGGRGMFAGQGGVIPPQDVAQVSANWPSGNLDPRMANYLCEAQQKWAITPVANAGGYPGSPYFKIAIAGTDRTLAASGDAELVVLPAFTGAPEQLWRFDQLADGSWRIMPKSVPNSQETLALSAVGSSFATLSRFDPSAQETALAAEDAVNKSLKESSMNGFLKGRTPALTLLCIAALYGAAAQTPPVVLTKPLTAEKLTGADGFIQRWMLLEPIGANGLTDSVVQASVKKEYFPDQLTVVPRDGDQVSVGGAELTWHAVETKDYNINLYRFANALGKKTSDVLFWAVTTVSSPREMSGVRLAIGSNAASVWWVNGNEVIGIYGDRQTVIDDGVSRRLTLKKGPNIVRAAIVNGGGATDFCARFLDADDKPIKGLAVSVGEVRK